jgi:hypothetical protein
MKKLVLTFFLFCSLKVCFAQLDYMSINLNKDNSRIQYIICPEVTLSILIYPELSRNGKYELIHKDGTIYYSDVYKDVDLVSINFKLRGVEMPNGRYKLKFTSDEGEIEYVSMLIKKDKKHSHPLVE